MCQATERQPIELPLVARYMVSKEITFPCPICAAIMAQDENEVHPVTAETFYNPNLAEPGTKHILAHDPTVADPDYSQHWSYLPNVIIRRVRRITENQFGVRDEWIEFKGNCELCGHPFRLVPNEEYSYGADLDKALDPTYDPKASEPNGEMEVHARMVAHPAGK